MNKEELAKLLKSLSKTLTGINLNLAYLNKKAELEDDDDEEEEVEDDSGDFLFSEPDDAFYSFDHPDLKLKRRCG